MKTNIEYTYMTFVVMTRCLKLFSDKQLGYELWLMSKVIEYNKRVSKSQPWCYHAYLGKIVLKGLDSGFKGL